MSRMNIRLEHMNKLRQETRAATRDMGFATTCHLCQSEMIRQRTAGGSFCNHCWKPIPKDDHVIFCSNNAKRWIPGKRPSSCQTYHEACARDKDLSRIYHKMSGERVRRIMGNKRQWSERTPQGEHWHFVQRQSRDSKWEGSRFQESECGSTEASWVKCNYRAK